MRMSLQGDLNQVYPSNPSCCPLWPSTIVNQKKKKNPQEKLGHTHLRCVFSIYWCHSPFNSTGLIVSCKRQMTKKAIPGHPVSAWGKACWSSWNEENKGVYEYQGNSVCCRYTAGIWVQAYTVKANKEEVGSYHREPLMNAPEMEWLQWVKHHRHAKVTVWCEVSWPVKLKSYV